MFFRRGKGNTPRMGRKLPRQEAAREKSARQACARELYRRTGLPKLCRADFSRFQGRKRDFLSVIFASMQGSPDCCNPVTVLDAPLSVSLRDASASLVKQ